MIDINRSEGKPIILPVLILEITQRCNLKCAHCLKGDACNINMSLETIDSIFKQINRVEFLLLTGGEPFLALNVIRLIIMKAKEYKVNIGKWKIVINGTIYYEESIPILNELDEICTYKYDNGLSGTIEISRDKYHKEAISSLGKRVEGILDNNINRNKQLPWFDCERDLSGILVNEGRCRNLNVPKGELKIDPYNIRVINNEVYINPPICVNARGIITTGDGSYENQMTKYNFGDINKESILRCIQPYTASIEDLEDVNTVNVNGEYDFDKIKRIWLKNDI